MKEQIEEILGKPEITYEAGDGSLQQESSLTLMQIEETASELCQLFEQAKAEVAREIIDWVENHGGCLDGFRREWQAFKKSKGIE